MAGDYRQRAAQTKRGHSQLAIIKAARERFDELGWAGTTLNAVAKQAGLSVGTLHNHFKTKHDLIARVFGGVMAVIVEDGQKLLNETEDVRETIEWMLGKLVETSIGRRNITAAMVAAMVEQPLMYPASDYDTGDALPEDYGAVVMVAAISDLIEMGQAGGIFKADLPAFQVASYHVTGALLLVTMHPEMTAAEARDLVIRQVTPAIKKPTEE